MEESSRVFALAGQPRRRALVVDRDEAHLHTLQRVVQAAGSLVEARTDLHELPSDGEFDLIVANYDTLEPEERDDLMGMCGGISHQTRLLLFTSGAMPEMANLLGKEELTNVVCRTEKGINTTELLVTARKLLNADIFGIEKYFPWGVTPVSLVLRRSIEKYAAVSMAERYARQFSSNPRFVSEFALVVDEFLTNALFNAPVDAEGNRPFAHLSRSEDITMPPGHEVVLRMCSDGKRLGISCLDHYGSLAPERVLRYLAKGLRAGPDQMDQKQGGAGLGFFMVFRALSHLALNISPGKATEIIGLLDVRGTYRQFMQKSKSFNVFIDARTAEGQAKAAAAAAIAR